MNLRCCLLALLACFLLPSLHLRAQSIRRLAPDLILAMPISTDAANDGSTVVADFTEPAVHYIGADGKLKWSLKSKGSGPGDILRPYRVAIGENTVWVYDFAVRDISVFSRAGSFLRRFNLSVALTSVDDIVAIGDSLLVVLGTTRIAGYENNAVHVFSASGAHKRSFGDIAVTSDRSKLSVSGTGSLARSLDNTIWYTRRGPFELKEYDVEGKLLRALVPPVSIPNVIDSLTRIDTNDKGRERISNRAGEVRFPLRAIPLSGGFFLSGVSDRGNLRWWIHSSSGARSPATLPKGMSPSTWNAKSCELLGTTEIDDQPALVAVEIRAVLTETTVNTMRCER